MAWDESYNGQDVYLRQTRDGEAGAIVFGANGVIDANGTEIAVTELAALNNLDATELGYVNGITPGTVTASKALVVDASKDLTEINDLGVVRLTLGASGVIDANGTELSVSELAVLNAVTPGTVAASKALVVDGSKDLTELNVVGLVGIDFGTNVGKIQLDSVDVIGIDTYPFTFAAAADANGVNVAIVAASGGTDTSVDGGTTGGLIVISGGAGGAGGADMDGGAAGGVAIAGQNGGAGGAHSANDPNGGNGGNITLQPGTGGAAGSGGSGAAGKPGLVIMSGVYRSSDAQDVNMNDAALTLTLNPAQQSGTLITSNIIFLTVGPTGNETLTLPREQDSAGLMLTIVNVDGANSAVVEDDAAGSVTTITSGSIGLVYCNGTSWRGTSV